ncbi:hypothetical protein [Streptomyces ossamyceticus]|uniref:hypothetical protein n=1 Tax=Streptomyces ossamyceticus TaxID=249581 RepID=UPI003EBF721B
MRVRVRVRVRVAWGVARGAWGVLAQFPAPLKEACGSFIGGAGAARGKDRPAGPSFQGRGELRDQPPPTRTRHSTRHGPHPRRP